ncbi:uncharacterized protein LOC144453606 [Glandiceps talaboti]
MDRWNSVILVVYLGLFFVTTSIEAADFLELLLGAGNRELSGSGQNDSPYPEMEPSIKLTKDEVLAELGIEPCPGGDGVLCFDSGSSMCYTFDEVCNGKLACGIEEECAEESDPEECVNNFVERSCQDSQIIRYLTSHGVPNFPKLRDEYDLDLYLDLVRYTSTEFCPDGRIECQGDCISYEDLCDPETDFCKCDGEEIMKIVDDKLLTQRFRDFMNFRRGGFSLNSWP